MKITYLLAKQALAERQGEIREEILHLLPEARVCFDESASSLTVELAPEADPAAAHESLRLLFLRMGVQATRVADARASFSGTPIMPGAVFPGGPAQPPHYDNDKGVKKPSTVKTSVFVISLIATVLVVSILAFSVGTVFGSVSKGGQTLGTGDQSGEDYVGKITLIDQLFEEYALYDTDGKLLLEEMLKAYVAATGDQYAAYYTEEEAAALFKEMSGGAVGIGITVTKDAESENILVIQVNPDSPAQQAGICAGDLIIKIGTKAEGVLISEIGYEMAVDKMAGEEGSVLQIVVLRDGQELELSATRAAITIQSVTGNVSTTDPSVGIVRISSFQAKTPAQFKQTVDALISAGCERFVFDVRNNLGGEQRSILAILSYFANEGDTLLCTVEKDGTTTYDYAIAQSYSGDYADCSVAREEIGMYRNYKNVVLTNGYTASAAELFTGALRDFDLTTQVGETTYGKGVKQSLIDLNTFGYTGMLRLTTGYYAPPLGVNYDGVGLVPEVPVDPSEEQLKKNFLLLTEAEDVQLSTAIAVLLEK